jgi:O-antigen/teichoic acid export membrane protein
MRLGDELRRLARHSAVYGLGGLVSRILATVLLPLYTHYLPTSAYGRVETITAATAVLAIVLQMGIATAFFRFYFDVAKPDERLTVIRTSLWAQTNYNQLTALFRVEQRSVQYAIASVVNVLVTVAAMVVFVAVFHWGAIGLVVGNFTGTLVVYTALVVYRTEQLGLEFDRTLFRAMQRFGMPLVPAALALWTINFVDREFLAWFKDQGEVGVYSVAVKVASIITFVMVAFRTAWPAFAYSIEDDREAKRTYAFVLTYLLAVTAWIALALGALAPWWVELLTSRPAYQRAEHAVALLAFAFTAYAGYTVLAIGSGRARRTQLNWVVTGAGAAVNVGLNFWLVPAYGMVGAAIATVAAYVALFLGMMLYAQSVYPVPYQWRRIGTIAVAAVGLNVAARLAHLPLAPSALLVLAYPLALAALGFYLPAERKRLRRFVPSFR